MMVEPVVVRPEVDSKKASAKPSCSRDSMKGSAANTQLTTQLRVMSRNPSRRPITGLWLVRKARIVAPPTPPVTVADARNAVQFESATTKSASAGSSISAASPLRNVPSA